MLKKWVQKRKRSVKVRNTATWFVLECEKSSNFFLVYGTWCTYCNDFCCCVAVELVPTDMASRWVSEEEPAVVWSPEHHAGGGAQSTWRWTWRCVCSVQTRRAEIQEQGTDRTELALSCNILNAINIFYSLTLFVKPDIYLGVVKVLIEGHLPCHGIKMQTLCRKLHVKFEVVLQLHLNKTLNKLFAWVNIWKQKCTFAVLYWLFFPQHFFCDEITNVHVQHLVRAHKQWKGRHLGLRLTACWWSLKRKYSSVKSVNYDLMRILFCMLHDSTVIWFKKRITLKCFRLSLKYILYLIYIYLIWYDHDIQLFYCASSIFFYPYHTLVISNSLFLKC